jgi:hypothetical protein
VLRIEEDTLVAATLYTRSAHTAKVAMGLDLAAFSLSVFQFPLSVERVYLNE